MSEYLYTHVIIDLCAVWPMFALACVRVCMSAYAREHGLCVVCDFGLAKLCGVAVLVLPGLGAVIPNFRHKLFN